MQFYTFLHIAFPLLSAGLFIYGLANLNLLLIITMPFIAYYSPWALEKGINVYAKITFDKSRYRNSLKLKEKRMSKTRLPIVYHPGYNIEAYGLESKHPFDARKYGRIFEFLQVKGILTNDKDVFRPDTVSRSLLLTVHTPEYLYTLCSNKKLAAIVEIRMLKYIPALALRWLLLENALLATQGSVDAAVMALQRGWSVNLSGGYHHACGYQGGGFCIYADITICIKHLQQYYPDRVKKVMIIDLDAHQGNGHERDFLNDSSVCIVDAYNPEVYPADFDVMKAIAVEIYVYDDYSDEKYLMELKANIPGAIENFKPDFILYNAGTDILQGDRVGSLNISEQGIIKRDEFIFGLALEKKIPITMVLSGGYQKSNALIIANSIENIMTKFKLA